jgi:hypothetical protein
LAVVIVLIAVVAVAYIMVTERSKCEVTLLITHYNPQYADPAIVAIYIDGSFEQEVTVECGKNQTVVFELTEGNHTIGFDYTIAPSIEPDGVVDYEFSVEITISDEPIEYSWNAG